MSPLETIDLGTPYHDPLSPLYPYSLRASTISTSTSTSAIASTMTHTSQLAPSPSPRDYFSHAPRSIIYNPNATHTPSPSSPGNEKPSPAPPSALRKPPRLLGYDQPTLNIVPADRPRAPLRRTLLRLALLCVLLGFAALGWRCESVGCKGRGGGGLVGEFAGGYGDGFVGGGSVVDLAGIWERPSWGGERVRGGGGGAVSSVDEEGEEAGELVGVDLDVQMEGDGQEAMGGDLEWDDEAGEFVDVRSSSDDDDEPISHDNNNNNNNNNNNVDIVDDQAQTNYKRDIPLSPQQASLITLIAGFNPIQEVAGEHALATTTPSIPSQSSISPDDDDTNPPQKEAHDPAPWKHFTLGWW